MRHRNVYETLEYENWAEEKSSALEDVLSGIQYDMHYETSEIPYGDDFEAQIKFIKEQENILKELVKDFKCKDLKEVNTYYIVEYLGLDEDTLPDENDEEAVKKYIDDALNTADALLNDIYGVLDEYDRDLPWHLSEVEEYDY